jgi:hypothetical protein
MSTKKRHAQVLENLRHAFIHSTLRFVEFLIVGVEFCCFFLWGLGWRGGVCCAYCFAVWKGCEFEGKSVEVWESRGGWEGMVWLRDGGERWEGRGILTRYSATHSTMLIFSLASV